jgi:hypothetical protein
MINSKISGVKIVNAVIDLKTVKMSADAGSDKNSILSGLLELL